MASRSVLSRVALAARLGGLLAGVSSLGCTLVVESGRVQCSTTADCPGSETLCIDQVCQPDPRWSCLATPPPTSPQAPPYRVAVTVQNVLSQEPIAGAMARLCRKLDIDCAKPLGVQTTDATGTATFTLEAGIAAYVDVTAAGFLPALYFFNPAIDRDQAVPAISLATQLTNGALIAQIGGKQLPERGSIVIQSQNCLGAPAAGVSYTTPDGDADTLTFYLINDLPTASAVETGTTGYGGVIDVPPGAVTLEARLSNPSRSLGTISLLVRPGAISYSRVVPNGTP